MWFFCYSFVFSCCSSNFEFCSLCVILWIKLCVLYTIYLLCCVMCVLFYFSYYSNVTCCVLCRFCCCCVICNIMCYVWCYVLSYVLRGGSHLSPVVICHLRSRQLSGSSAFIPRCSWRVSIYYSDKVIRFTLSSPFTATWPPATQLRGGGHAQALFFVLMKCIADWLNINRNLTTY